MARDVEPSRLATALADEPRVLLGGSSLAGE
jgi:hypothetical protein